MRGWPGVRTKHIGTLANGGESGLVSAAVASHYNCTATRYSQSRQKLVLPKSRRQRRPMRPQSTPRCGQDAESADADQFH